MASADASGSGLVDERMKERRELRIIGAVGEFGEFSIHKLRAEGRELEMRLPVESAGERVPGQ